MGLTIAQQSELTAMCGGSAAVSFTPSSRGDWKT